MWLKAVTYGPFPAAKSLPILEDFARIRAAGFNAIRVFTLPDMALLDAARAEDLIVFAGLDWRQHEDFISRPGLVSSARIRLSEWLGKHGFHKALGGIYVGNEIPSDLVRWMGPTKVREVIESIIETGRESAPHLLFAYANYPSTEYLEPSNADFSAFNIYLEDRDSFTAYLRRLHNIAGDRPLVVSEFGMDSFRNSEEIQAATLGWALEVADREETAGITIFSWSDLWENNGREIDDWNFGIIGRDGAPKPAYRVCADFSRRDLDGHRGSFSVIVCTRNGAGRISGCLRAIEAMKGGPYETIVVDDGSTDGTADIVSRDFPSALLMRIPPSGLSTARNHGASNASGDILAFTDDDCEPDVEWILRLGRAFRDPSVAAAGGPNLPPPARTSREAIIRATPGAPSHVLLSDDRAEHLPGCNIAVRKEAFERIGGFDPAFRTAGDDVDFCWRLRENGFDLAFVPGAFVWHWRRRSIHGFLKQQWGYGKAERILLEKHPDRFTKRGEARWDGFVYGGGPVRVDRDSIIYHGPMGMAGYQSVTNRMLPLRPLDGGFTSVFSNFQHRLVVFLQPLIRSWSRNRRIAFPEIFPHANTEIEEVSEFRIRGGNEFSRERILEDFISHQWQAAGASDPWDVEKDGTRVLVATERLDHQHLNSLFRVWGDPAPVHQTLDSISDNF